MKLPKLPKLPSIKSLHLPSRITMERLLIVSAAALVGVPRRPRRTADPNRHAAD